MTSARWRKSPVSSKHKKRQGRFYHPNSVSGRMPIEVFLVLKLNPLGILADGLVSWPSTAAASVGLTNSVATPVDPGCLTSRVQGVGDPS